MAPLHGPKPLKPPARGAAAEQLRAIAEGMAAVAAPVATSVDEVLARIASVARDLAGAQYCALGIGTTPEMQFDPWVFSGMTDEEARAIGRTPRPVCLLGAVPHRGHTIRLADMSGDPAFCGFPPHHPPMQSFLGVPVRLGDRSMGNLYLTNKVGAEAFTEEDQLIVEALAVHAAVAVESARLYEDARRRTIQLEEERQQRETFISVVSHELRGPITVLLGYSDLLRQGDKIPPDRHERALKAVGDQARQMNRLIGDLLDTSRIQTGRFAIDKEPIDLVEVAQRAIVAQQATAPDRAIHLEAPEHLAANADEIRIAQALTNLIGNAIKYSPEGSPVWVRVRSADGESLISVTDEGVGITAEQMPQLFQPYSRAYREQRAIKGIGLGLFITKGIVEAHGGRIWAESPGSGQGTTFNFTLPAAGDDEEAE